MEVGSTYVLQPDRDTWYRVDFEGQYTQPVVILSAPSFRGTQAMNIRVRSVTSTGFEWQMDEWEVHDGWHMQETIAWLVVEAGNWTLPNGQRVVAGVRDSVGSAFQRVSLPSFGTRAPVVLAQVAEGTVAGGLTHRMRRVDGTGFDLRVDSQEARRGAIGTARTYYVAIERGSVRDVFDATLGGDVYTHATEPLSFEQSFAATPHIFATMQSQDGGDTATVRYRIADSDSTRLIVHEEKSRDSEINHTTETIGALLVSPNVSVLDLEP